VIDSVPNVTTQEDVPSASHPLVSLIIPTYNRPDALKRCLEGVANLDFPREQFEVIIVDDGSEQPPDSVIAAFTGRLPVHLLTQTNAGPSSARNTGVKAARGWFLAFTDDDCVPDRQWLRILIDDLLKHPDAMVGGRTGNLLTDNVYAETSQMITDIVYGYYNRDPEDARFIIGNNFALSREQFLKAGWFYDTFHLPAAEDREFCDRWHFHGYKMRYLPDAVIYHGSDLTLRSFFRMYANYGRGAALFYMLRAGRGSGGFITEARFHLHLNNWLITPILSQRGIVNRLRTGLLIGLWQFANALGFLTERVNLRKWDRRMSQ